MCELPARARRPRLVRALLALCMAGPLLLGAAAASADALDPAGVQQALARGAVAWDLRDGGDVLLPGAVRIERGALAAWLDRGDLGALAQAVSAAGLNLAGEVVVYGDAADAERTRRVVERLRPLSRGRVHWLEGGIDAWQSGGLPVAARPAVRLPLPQRLVAVAGEPGAAPADANRRMSRTFAVDEAPFASARF